MVSHGIGTAWLIRPAGEKATIEVHWVDGRADEVVIELGSPFNSARPSQEVARHSFPDFGYRRRSRRISGRRRRNVERFLAREGAAGNRQTLPMWLKVTAKDGQLSLEHERRTWRGKAHFDNVPKIEITIRENTRKTTDAIFHHSSLDNPFR